MKPTIKQVIAALDELVAYTNIKTESYRGVRGDDWLECEVANHVMYGGVLSPEGQELLNSFNGHEAVVLKFAEETLAKTTSFAKAPGTNAKLRRIAERDCLAAESEEELAAAVVKHKALVDAAYPETTT